MDLANTPKSSYYVVIFSSLLKNHEEQYQRMAKKMDELARIQPGFLGFESAREKIGLSISYWESLEAIQDWKNNVQHQEAQKNGKSDWYDSYKVRIARVEYEYSFDKL